MNLQLYSKIGFSNIINELIEKVKLSKDTSNGKSGDKMYINDVTKNSTLKNARNIDKNLRNLFIDGSWNIPMIFNALNCNLKQSIGSALSTIAIAELQNKVREKI